MKTSFAVALAAVAATSAAAAPLTQEQYQFLFTRFVDTYEKSYESNSFFSKFNTFKNNVDLILAHNANPEKTFTMGMNQFGDLTQAEFAKLMTLGQNVHSVASSSSSSSFDEAQKLFASAPVAANGACYDWRKNMNPVKNQASCGSCWAFAATAGLEGAYNVLKGKNFDFSEQQLVDCDKASSGCNGGLMSNAYAYIKSAGGICQQSAYPYTAKNGVCRDSSCLKVATVTGYKSLSTEAEIIDALSRQPVPVALAASSSAFQFYSSGVIKAEDGCGTGVNHGVTAVAFFEAHAAQQGCSYSDIDSAVPYYLIRNSWGATWGDKGHVRIEARKNVCGIVRTSFAAIPTI